jgi:hypothetical protein
MGKGGFFVGGCYYSEYRCLAYPLQSFPSGGVFNKRPDYYQDYEKHVRDRKRQAEEKYEQDRQEQFKNFFRGFFGFDQDEGDKESLDRDYPYNVFGLKRSASDDDMKKAYRKAVLKAHPDKGGSNELFRRIRQAWEYFTKN